MFIYFAKLQIVRRKWGWIRHTLRKPVTSTTPQALTWNPQSGEEEDRVPWKHPETPGDSGRS